MRTVAGIAAILFALLVPLIFDPVEPNATGSGPAAPSAATPVAGDLESRVAALETRTAGQPVLALPAAAQATIAAYATAQAADATALAALSESHATTAAVATQSIIGAEATIEVYATARAEDEATIGDLLVGMATAAAREADAAATADALAARAAEIANVATVQARAGQTELGEAQQTAAAAQATIDALAAGGEEDAARLATAQAGAADAAATVAALEAEQAGLQVTATALAQEAFASSLNPNARTLQIQTDFDGIVSGDDLARDKAVQRLRSQVEPYPTPECRAGFVLVSGYAPSFEQGLLLANAVEDLIFAEFPETFTEGTGSQPFGDTSGDVPTGRVVLEAFFYNGCVAG